MFQEFDHCSNFLTIRGHTLAVSPDGTQFVYSTSEGLYIRSEDELEARLIPGTDDNPQSPFFSPDGQWIGYWSQADNQLKKIAIRGGTPVTLCDVGTLVYGVYPDRLPGDKLYLQLSTEAPDTYRKSPAIRKALVSPPTTTISTGVLGLKFDTGMNDSSGYSSHVA
jgi:hypothetical protein